MAPDLAGEIVTLWWGLFDEELYVEHGEHRYGPYPPAGGPIPLHRYRRFKKTATQQRADRIEDLPASSASHGRRWRGHPFSLPSPAMPHHRRCNRLLIPTRFMS